MKPTKDFIYDLYVIRQLTRREIAKVIGVSPTTVLRYMKLYAIPRRTHGESLKGKSKSLEHRQKLSNSKKGKNNPNFGKKRNHGYRCWYTCHNGKTVSMRSHWEVWYAEYLKANNIAFQYEPITFTLEDGSAYTPDFYLLASNEYVEVKGWFTDKHKQIIEKFHLKYPEQKLIIADKTYLEVLGIDLTKKWISTKPQFACEYCKNMYYRNYPTKRFCSVVCRAKAFGCWRNRKATEKIVRPKRKYNKSNKGELNNAAKLNWEQVNDIRRLRIEGKTYKEINIITKVSIGNIYNIVRRKSWK